MKYTEPENYVQFLRVSSQPQGNRLEESATEDHPSAVIRRVRRGLPMSEFRALAEWLQVTEEELAPLLGISRATYHRRRKNGHLECPESEKLVRFARLLCRSTEVFEDENAARDWLKAPALSFGNESPLSFADTEIGAREVEFLLGRLEHGVFS